jgi:hypothetical protein
MERQMEAREIEGALVTAFVVANLRNRFLEGLASPKKRRKILSRLDHNIDDFDERYRLTIPKSRHSADHIAALLASKGAPNLCYVVSSWDQFDRRELPLRDALIGVVGYGMGTLVSCVPGRLAYYEAEGPGERYILERAG